MSRPELESSPMFTSHLPKVLGGCLDIILEKYLSIAIAKLSSHL